MKNYMTVEMKNEECRMKNGAPRFRLCSGFLLSVCLGIALLTGCAGRQLTPQFAGLAAQALVADTLRNSPETATEIKLASEAVCMALQGPNDVTTQTIHDSVSVQNFSLSTVALLNGLQMIYTPAVVAGAKFTPRDYAKAIFCVGIPAGLDQLPAGPRQGPQPRSKARPLYSPHDPRFALWEKP